MFLTLAHRWLFDLLESIGGSKAWAYIGFAGLMAAVFVSSAKYRNWKIYKKIMKDKAKRENEIAPDPDAPFPQEAFATEDSPAQTKPDESPSSQVDQAQRGPGQDPPVKK